MRLLHTMPVLLILAALTGLSCGSVDEPYLARVGGEPITVTEWQHGYVDYLTSTGLADDPARRSAYLEQMIGMELVRQEARTEGLDQTPEYAFQEERARRALLVDAWLDDVVFDSIRVTTADMEEMFVRLNTKVTARHLYASTREGAERLLQRLGEGETFETLAREVFADPELAESGGSVGSFGFDEMDIAFEDAAYSLPVGELSEPVRTAQGWSVIRVDDRFTEPVLTETEFATRIPQLRNYVTQRRRAAARRILMDRLTAEWNPRVDDETADRFMASVTPGGVTPAGDAESLAEDAPIVRFGNGQTTTTWTVADFRERALYTDELQRSRVRDRQTLDAFISGLVFRDIMMDASRNAGLQRSDRYRVALDIAMNEWLYEQAYGRLADQAHPTEDTVRAYYEANHADFMRPASVRISEIAVASLAEARDAHRALSGSTFEEVARSRSIRAESAGSGGDLGWLTRDELGPFADDVFGAAAGSVIGPLEARGAYLLLLVGETRPPREATFEEIRPDIITMLSQATRRDFMRRHVSGLRDRYAVEYSELEPGALPLAPASSHSI